jgi:hypothetical protein
MRADKHKERIVIQFYARNANISLLNFMKIVIGTQQPRVGRLRKRWMEM